MNKLPVLSGKELIKVLEKAGFSDVKIIDESFEQNEQAVVYVASNPGKI